MDIDNTEADVSAVVMRLRAPENILSDVDRCLKHASVWFPANQRFQESIAIAATVERSQRLAFPIMATKVTRRTVPKHPLWELCKGVLYFALGPIALIWALSNFFPSLHSLVQYLITP
jgi:hypothetical protein